MASANSGAAQRPTRRVLRVVLQLAVTGALGLFALSLVDLDALQFSALDLCWLGLGLACTLPQYLGVAARWWFTARRLGVRLSFADALGEYYVGGLMNMLLPSGLSGDAVRVVRHGKELGTDAGGYALSLRVVILERLSGQIVLWACVLLSLPLWLGALVMWQALLVIALGSALVFAVFWFARRRMAPWLKAYLSDAQRALVAREAWPTQLATSLVTILSSVLLFACCACAVRAPLGLGSLLRVGPLLLASMTVPLAVGGWGIRELASTALYAASGLDPATGASTSVLYGLVSLVGSVPGALWALGWRSK